MSTKIINQQPPAEPVDYAGLDLLSTQRIL